MTLTVAFACGVLVGYLSGLSAVRAVRTKEAR
jgi:hypothetical protein